MRAQWHLRANVVVVAWMLAAAVATMVHRVLPSSSWLMVHLLMLGAVSAAILIWSAHFTEALRRRELPGGRRGQAIRLVAHSVAAIAVIVGVVGAYRALVLAGGAVLVAVAVWHASVIAAASRGALGNHLGWSTWGYVASASALGAGVVCGVLLSRGLATAEGSARMYLAHVSFMILGWVALTVMATLLTLWPTVLAVRVAPGATEHARGGLIVMGGGLVVAVSCLGAGLRLGYAAGVVIAAAGIAWAAVPMVLALRERGPQSVAALHLAAAVAWLLGSVLTWGAMAAVSPDFATLEKRLGGVVAAIVAGAAAQVLLGSLTHLMPMVLGGGPHAVRASRATVEKGAFARFVLVNGGVALWVLPAPSLVRVVGSTLALVAALWMIAALVRAVVVSRKARANAPVAPQFVPADHLADRPRLRGSGGAVVAACVLLFATAAAVAADPAATGIGASASAEVTATGKTVVVEVEAKDMAFTPGDIEVAAGDHLVIEVMNTDTVAHDLVLDTGQSSGRISAGDSATLDVGVVGRDVEGWCSIAGHRQMGMTLSIEVVGRQGGAVAEPDEGDSDADHTGMDHGDMDHGTVATADDINLHASTDVEPYDAALAPASDATVHRVTLEVTNELLEVAPGYTQTMWTFNGSVPAPTLRGKIGDTFEITLVNNGDMAHSIDFHASQIAPDDVMRSIEPGESLTYRFEARSAGAWLYHCSTMPMSTHIANGMYGAVIIDPPDLEPVDREYVVVQQEMYLGEQGGIVDSDKVFAEDADLVTFNGHATQYVENPLEATVGERVRFWVVDAGPSRATSFHVVGEQFDTVYYEGAYQLGGPDGGADAGGAQALALQPGQGGFVEFTADNEGTFPFVSHIMIDAERGAKGLLSVSQQGSH
ncbi:multicopper oxidase domain-containing protein [Demequina sp.]|uniref:multicopper oxidase domain-containing protein n=1 Tax=Demequina sp. TaxID=2050685 RepID=UPI003A8B78C9